MYTLWLLLGEEKGWGKVFAEVDKSSGVGAVGVEMGSSDSQCCSLGQFSRSTQLEPQFGRGSFSDKTSFNFASCCCYIQLIDSCYWLQVQIFGRYFFYR